MSLPPELGSILDDNKFKKNKFMIPYYAKTAKVYRVHVLAINDDIEGGIEDNETIYNRTTDAFITHFFPEYYPFLMIGYAGQISELLEEFNTFRPDYDNIRDLIYNSLSVKKVEFLLPLPKQSPRVKIVMESSLDFVQQRSAMMFGDKLPEMTAAIEVFSLERQIENLGGQTTFDLSIMPDTVESLTGVLNGFGNFARAGQNIFSAPVNFTSMQSATSQIVKYILQSVYDSVRTDESDSPPQAYDTDYITIYFDQNDVHPKVAYIEYMILNITAGDPEIATVGFISNVKYNPIFRDPLAMVTLKNQEQILQNAAQSSGLTQQASITKFFKLLGAGTSPAGNFSQIPGSMTPGNNIFGNRPAGDIVDISDIQRLENVFNTVMTPEEVRQLEKSAQDPKIKKQILQKQKATKLKAGIQTVKVIDNILNFNFPLFGPNLSKQGRAVNAILAQFGIQELAKEALICLTLGLGATASRVTKAVLNSIVQTASSLRTDPVKPSDEINIVRAELSKRLKNPEAYYSVLGNTSEKIKNIVLNALANAAFEVIKSLSEMIQLNCGQILRDLAGAVDLGEEIRKRANLAAPDVPNLEDLINDQFASYGITAAQGYSYLSDVSAILDPRQICRLLNAPEEVLDATIDDIIDFNSEYPVAAISENLTNRTAIIAYFQQFVGLIDTVTFCNDLINDYIATTVANCDICLDTDFLEANPAIDDLINIAENGITLLPPEIDFMCPDRDSYLENPVATTILPNLWNNILDTTKIYVAGSLESARTSLLEPSIATTINSDLLQALEGSGVEMPTASVDPEALKFIKGLFDFIKDIGNHVGSMVENSGAACADIDNDKLDQIVFNIGVIVDAINAALEEVPGVIEEVDSKISSLQQALSEGGSGAIPHVEYVFPQAFEFSWLNSIRPLEDLDSAGYEGNKFLVETAGAFEVGHGHFGGAFEYEPSPENIFGPIQVQTDADRNIVGDYVITFSKPGASGNQTAELCSITYPSFDPTNPKGSLLTFEYSLGKSNRDTIEDVVPIEYQYDTDVLLASNPLVNPYLSAFVEAVATQPDLRLDITPDVSEDVIKFLGTSMSSCYGALFERMFSYIYKNGAFSRDKINNLKLFKNNSNCAPENVGDLFDSAGILDQMKQEFASAACEDKSSNKDKVRNTLYFGLIMMLIQAIIDEFIVKNIIVFTAFRMDEVLDSKYPFREFMVNDIVRSFKDLLGASNGILEREVSNYFIRRAARPSTLQNGGIVHSYDPENVPAGFEGPNYSQNLTVLIRFLVKERLGYVWKDGITNRSTTQAIKNILQPPGSIPMSLDDIVLRNILYVGLTIENNLRSLTSLQKHGESNYFPTNIQLADDVPNNQMVLLYNSDRDGITVRSRIGAIQAWTYPEGATLDEKFEIVKSSQWYQNFVSRTFNKSTLLMVPLVYNFYLTDKYFSDIRDSFRGTKRAIINYMNMTDASANPPLPNAPNNEFIETLANDGEQDLGSLALEIFLKFLRETPIQILKGLVELIDPHVAISKIIRDSTGLAFLTISQAITTQIQATPGPIQDSGITGQDILGLILCVYNIVNQSLLPPLPPGIAADFPLIGPRMSLKGVDFKGTVSGMLMTAPSPIGVIYLLLEILNSLLDTLPPGDQTEENTDLTSPSSAENDC